MNKEVYRSGPNYCADPDYCACMHALYTLHAARAECDWLGYVVLCNAANHIIGMHYAQRRDLPGGYRELLMERALHWRETQAVRLLGC